LIPAKGRDGILREGILLKRNEWYWKQERHFVLHTNGELKYYKDGNQRGTIMLNAQTRLQIESRSHLELHNAGRVYHLFCKKPDLMAAWIDDMRSVI
jgi:hypothetical protein